MSMILIIYFSDLDGDGVFHSILRFFVSESYWKTQVSCPRVTSDSWMEALCIHVQVSLYNLTRSTIIADDIWRTTDTTNY